MEKCPYHDSEPVSEEKTVREAVSASYADWGGALREYRLPAITLHKVYCRECRNEQQRAGKTPRKFGKGFTARSAAAAGSRWDAACMTERLRIFKKAVRTGGLS